MKKKPPPGSTYRTGYCRPPKNSQWKPGEQGFKGGRKKGSRNFKTEVKNALNAPVQVRYQGQPKTISTQKALLARLLEKAWAGDVRALDRMIQLAQMYNNEELAGAIQSAVDDEAILEIYNKRRMSGAAFAPGYDESRRLIDSEETSKIEKQITPPACFLRAPTENGSSTDEGVAALPRRQIPRRRLSSYKPPNMDQ